MRKVRTQHDEFETTFILDSADEPIGIVSRDLTLPGVWNGHRWEALDIRTFPTYREALRFAVS